VLKGRGLSRHFARLKRLSRIKTSALFCGRSATAFLPAAHGREARELFPAPISRRFQGLDLDGAENLAKEVSPRILRFPRSRQWRVNSATLTSNVRARY